MHKPSTSDFKFNKRIVKRLNQTILTIKALYKENLLELCVFGSYAKGSQGKFSSVDLLVIIEESEERFIKRNTDLQRILNEDDQMPLIDPLVYTEDELIDLIRKKESFIDSALDEAFVIWNGFNKIDISEINIPNHIPSRYNKSTPKLEKIDH